MSRHLADAECAPLREVHRYRGRITRWQDIEYHRRARTCRTAGSRVGVLPNADGTDPDAFHAEVM